MIVDLEGFCRDHDVAIVVISRDRANELAKRTDKLLEGYHLFYSGEGYEDYPYRAAEMHKVPRGVQGLSVVRNYVLDKLPHKTVVFFDDDIRALYWISSAKSVALDTERTKLMIMNLVVHSRDLGALAFGLTPNDIRKSSPLAPFMMRNVAACVVGVNGREIRFDERNLLKVDYDFFLQAMVKNRVVHIDRRYYFVAGIETVPGGNTAFRTQERRLAEIENLQRWWGDDVIKTGRSRKGTESLEVKVP